MKIMTDAMISQGELTRYGRLSFVLEGSKFVHKLFQTVSTVQTFYVNALIKESMRWQQATPLGLHLPLCGILIDDNAIVLLGFGHMSTQGDVYDGYYIPKGTIVMGNEW
jgi:hypothetical protein